MPVRKQKKKTNGFTLLNSFILLDIVVHRLLQACIEQDFVYGPELIDADKMKSLCDNLNIRNRMAQQAGRSSVELFTSLFFRNKKEVCEGRIVRILKNGISVLVPKYGIESIIYTNVPMEGRLPFVYDDEGKTLIADDVILRTFDGVKVEISVEGDVDGMRQKMNMKLVEPLPPKATEDGSQPNKRPRTK